MNKLETLELWYREIWQNGNLAVIDEVFAPGKIASLPLPGDMATREEFAEFLAAAQMLLTDITPVITQSVEQGDRLAAVVTVHAKRADNGQPVLAASHIMARFENGKIVEKHTLLDLMSLFEQLGQLPQDSVAICMTGQCLDAA